MQPFEPQEEREVMWVTTILIFSLTRQQQQQRRQRQRFLLLQFLLTGDFMLLTIFSETKFF